MNARLGSWNQRLSEAASGRRSSFSAFTWLCLVATVLPNTSSAQDGTEIAVYEAALEYGSRIRSDGPVFLAARSFTTGEERSRVEERRRRLKVDSVGRALGLAVRTFDEVARCEPGEPTRHCDLLVSNYVHLSNAEFEGDRATVAISWSTPAARRSWVLRFEPRETGWELDHVRIRSRGHGGAESGRIPPWPRASDGAYITKSRSGRSSGPWRVLRLRDGKGSTAVEASALPVRKVATECGMAAPRRFS